MATKRVNIRVSESMHQWFMNRSEETGVAMSALMALALEEHMVQRQSIMGLDTMNKLIENHNNGKMLNKGE